MLRLKKAFLKDVVREASPLDMFIERATAHIMD